jgi:hypothetical protein
MLGFHREFIPKLFRCSGIRLGKQCQESFALASSGAPIGQLPAPEECGSGIALDLAGDSHDGTVGWMREQCELG